MNYCIKLSRYRKKVFAGKENEKPLNTTVFFLLCEVMLVYEPAGRSFQRMKNSKRAADRAENFTGASAAAESDMIERCCFVFLRVGLGG